MWTALAAGGSAVLLALAGYIGRLGPQVSPEPPSKPEEAEPTTDPVELRLRLQESGIDEVRKLSAEYRSRLCALEHQQVELFRGLVRQRAGKRAKERVEAYNALIAAWPCPATAEQLEQRQSLYPPSVAAEKALAP